MLLELNIVQSFLQLSNVLKKRFEMLCTCQPTKLNIFNNPLLPYETGESKNVYVITIFSMFIMIQEMTSMHIKVYGFMIRGFISETKPVDSLMISHELMLVTCLVPNVMDLFVIWSLNLEYPSSQSHHNQVGIKKRKFRSTQFQAKHSI